MISTRQSLGEKLLHSSLYHDLPTLRMVSKRVPATVSTPSSPSVRTETETDVCPDAEKRASLVFQIVGEKSVDQSGTQDGRFLFPPHKLTPGKYLQVCCGYYQTPGSLFKNCLE
jgi:hypothetical protein